MEGNILGLYDFMYNTAFLVMDIDVTDTAEEFNGGPLGRIWRKIG